MTTVAPFLMFQDGRAEEAMRLYEGIVPNSRVVTIMRHGGGGAGGGGGVMKGEMVIGGTRVFFSDSPIKHAFDFTPSVSLWVDCASPSELDAMYAALVEGGASLMPPGNYGFSERFAWVQDRYKVTWQLNFAGKASD